MIRFQYFLLIAFFLFSFTVANATEESNNPNNLPNCPAKENEKWNNCFGIWKKNGISYSGEFQKNKFNGYGIYIDDNGKKYYGQFKDNIPDGEGTYVKPDGSWYSGQIKNLRPDGNGTELIVQDRVSYKSEGTFKDGKRISGKITKYYSSGAIEEGTYINGKQEGLATYIDSNGRKAKRTYKDNVLINEDTFNISWLPTNLFITLPLLASIFLSSLILAKPFKNNIFIAFIGIAIFTELFCFLENYSLHNTGITLELFTPKNLMTILTFLGLILIIQIIVLPLVFILNRILENKHNNSADISLQEKKRSAKFEL